jgi:class 3 adenylate cyclase
VTISEEGGGLHPGAVRLGRAYGRYIPRLIIERLRREARAVDAPSTETFRAAILFADISGFTPLTEAFAERGPEGAEALTRILNDYFGLMCETVFDQGGDVLKFAGDALLALWRPDADGGNAGDVCARAVLCGKALQDRLEGYTAEGHPLSLRVAVGFGEVMVVHVGGQFGRWEFAIAGGPLNQVGRIGDLADPGDVLISTEVFSRLRAPLEADLVLNPDADPDLTEWPPRRVLRIDGVEAQRARPPKDLPIALQDALRGYLPASITRRISAGQTDFLGELRRLTILFVNLPDIDYQTPLKEAQEAFSSLQKALYIPWEGSINKLSVDDKGISLVAALGLPPFAHEDDPARGALAAMAMHKALAAVGQRCSIGVTTGRVYCGSVGGVGRQEYTIMGDRVNLAARLMQRADGGILCDADTVARSLEEVIYSEPETLTVKGKSEPLEVRRPEGARERTQTEPADEGLLIGREAETEMLTLSLASLLEAGRSGLVYVEGEAGVGKSRLVDDFVASHARPLPVRILCGAADAIDRITPYHAFQPVVLDLFALHDVDAAERRERVRHALRGDAAALELLPLLDDVLPMEFPETELTRQMTGEVRATNLQTLMVALLQFAASARPLLVVIDDAHWLDSASWELLRACVRQVSPLLAVVTGRPLGADEMPDVLRGFLEAPETLLLNLDRMEPEECIELVERRLGIDALPAPAAALIRDRGEGHPYFSEEIGYALRDSGALVLEGRRARMAQRGGSLEVEVPDTIEGIITSRIDRLSPQQQLALKVASCIGRVFSTRVLYDVYPVEEDRVSLPQQLQALSGLDLTPAEANEPEETWVFKHAITRQVAYDLMLYAQRKQLHKAIAQWYERNHAEDLEPHYPLLAHHWSRAEDAERSLHYLPLAAASALAANAAAEAIEFVRAVQVLASENDAISPSTLERARWLMMRGRAEHALGHLAEARTSLEQALGLLGHAVPESRAGLLLAVGNLVRRQVGHRKRELPPGPDDPAESERLELAAQAAERLFLIYVFANDGARALWSVLRATQLAESLGRPTPLLIRCYTDLAAALTSVPMHDQAAYYAECAMELVEQFPDDLIDSAWANLGTAVCLVGQGLWSEIERRALASLESNLALGDIRRWEEASENIGRIRTLYGRFDDAESGVYMPLLATARKRGSRQSEGWGLALWGMNLIYRQEFDELDAVAEQLERWLVTFAVATDDIARLDAVAVLAFHAQLRGEEDRLGVLLDEGMTLIDALGRPSLYRVLPAVSLFAEVVLGALRDAPKAEVRARRRMAERVLACVRAYAKIFEIGVPRLAWLEGRLAWYAGRERAAFDAWRRAAEAAETLEMAYDAMLAARSLADCLPEGEEQARRSEEADRLLEELGVPGSTFLCSR